MICPFVRCVLGCGVCWGCGVLRCWVCWGVVCVGVWCVLGCGVCLGVCTCYMCPRSLVNMCHVMYLFRTLSGSDR